ncbi:histone-arginine methyltransferase METTL23-like isoform X3 [Physella acuta]|uniref:histone-arginine methyltransferase METTL23-like isoform X2 n=1 Tax=Physella acuta TaxID=109671 RepID=UPI0027DCFB4E|nr:histone-arginine methyltransferase METTL23-like isoform X2 [Physella acuta]XP_059163952.1 histone-arginine methyltransferase METTL23-like isoform X3 [Physella acuta]
MTNTFKSFTFHGSCEEDFISVKIPEFADAAYGLYIWPCAPVLSQFIWLNRERIKGKSVLEIGAGTALPGIVAAKCGANVILSDSNSYPQCLDICRESAQLNDVPNVAVVGITWGEVTSVLTDLPNIDVILSSDCFYDSKDFEDVIMTLSYLLHKTPTAEVWCTYQERR